MFAVWQPMLLTDWGAPTSFAMKRLSDRRVQQYWDPKHVLATLMKNHARPPQPAQDCCVRSGILWDLAAVYPSGVSWERRLPPATLFNGPVVDVASEIESLLASLGRTSAILSKARVR